MVRRRFPRMAEPDDPFLWAMAPPAFETPAQRAEREAEEERARRMNEWIDEQIQKDVLERRKRAPVKVLLLGRENCGKAAFLRGFRKSYAPRTWQEERKVWSTAIRLDLVRSVIKILNGLDDAPDTPHRLSSLRMRLNPLRRAQLDLEKLLGLSEGEEMCGTSVPELVKRQQLHTSRLGELVTLINVCCDDMAELWKDSDVRTKLETYGIQLDEHSRFFLDDIHRITERGYEPSDDDVTHMRSRTIRGVQEYHFVVETWEEAGNEWIFYDIGCSSTRRASWIPYFMDANAIVFHASISVFNQYLEEDPQINCLEDSLKAWTTICKSTLLAKVPLILILSGCDALEVKLKQGISLRKYIPSYGDRANDLPTVTRYIREKFRAISRKVSPEPRPVYVHPTTSTDSDLRTMREVVSNVRHGIMTDKLKAHSLI